MDEKSVTKKTPAHILRALSVEAQADPRTVARVIRGGRARGMVHDRIVEALAKRGITPANAADLANNP